MTPEYDEIAHDYAADAEQRDDREMVLIPSAKHYCGDITNLSVLDLACGSGYFTRLLKHWGASNVIGVDISAEEIKIARDKEAASPLGVSYEVADVTNLGVIGDFDVLFAGFLLHYSESVEALFKMCKAIASNLKPNRRLVCFNENPNLPVHSGIKYGVSTDALGPIEDGVTIRRTHYEGDVKKFSFEHRHFSQSTYEAALTAAGFTDIQWSPFVSSNADNDYWNEYISNFSIIVLTATKSPV